MELVTVLAAQLGTDARTLLNARTARQVEHMATAYIKDKMFVVHVLLRGFGGGVAGSPGDAGPEKTGPDKAPAARPAAKLPGWVKPMKPRPGVRKVTAAVIDLRDEGSAAAASVEEIWRSQVQAVRNATDPKLSPEGARVLAPDDAPGE